MMQKAILFTLSFLFFISLITFQTYSKSSLPNINGKYGQIKIKQVTFETLKNWENDKFDLALKAFIKSCEKFASLPDDKKIGQSLKGVRIRDLQGVCTAAIAINNSSNSGNLVQMQNKNKVNKAKSFFENWFVPYEVSDSKNGKKGLFTGYYEIELHGSDVRTERYRYPIYRRPKDLIDGVRYLTRAEIENGALDRRGLEILYVDDKVDLFFLHVQGSGRVIHNDGKITRVGFSAKNNRPYTSLGRAMIKEKILKEDEVSAESIKTWLKFNPFEADEIMQKNESFIFFTKLNDGYIIGAQGVPLMPERSLAVDKNVIPFGMPLWLQTTIVDASGERSDYNRLMIPQDTGSAIKGGVRGDIFFGHGQRAEELASYMSERGRYYMLLPKAVVKRVYRNKNRSRR
jgi:membrane-bound lytic murein transglycosylase A